VRLYADDGNARAHEAYKVGGRRAGAGPGPGLGQCRRGGVPRSPNALPAGPPRPTATHLPHPYPFPQRLGMSSHYTVFEDMFCGY
jgi:hypothetical protein